MSKVELFNGDCIPILKKIPDKSFDLILTDPPYGVGLEYDSLVDTQENIKKLINNFMPVFLRISKVTALSCGVINTFLYPPSDWILAWIMTGGGNSSSWGFSCWQPILVYGKDPYLSTGRGRRPDIIMDNVPADRFWKTKHPCPKPITFWRKLFQRLSGGKQIKVLDPFMGIGTTGVICKEEGCDFTGIELSEKYFSVAEKRINDSITSMFR